MELYHKIMSVWKRDPETNYKTFLEECSTPEIQYLHNVDAEWEWTEKVDGTNIRVHFKREVSENHIVVFGGRSDNADLPEPLINALTDMFIYSKAFDKLDYSIDEFTLYGEGYGGKIQRGSKYRPDQSFVLFDVRVGPYWLEREDVVGVAELLEVDVVPIMYCGPISVAAEIAAKGFTSHWGSFGGEGLVGRPLVQLFDRYGQRIIVKLKTKDFS